MFLLGGKLLAEDSAGVMAGHTRRGEDVPGVGDLAGAGVAGAIVCAALDLLRGFDPVADAMQPSFADAPAEGVHGQVAAELDAPMLDPIERLASSTQAETLKPPEDGRGEPAVEHGALDILWGQPGGSP